MSRVDSARIGTEIIAGLATGGAGAYAKGGTLLARGAQAVCLLDTAGNATQVGMGINDVINTGSFSFSNTLQIVGGGFGLTGNFAGAMTKIKVKAPETNMGPACVLSFAACFVPGTQVVTATGLKNIEDIKVGDFVLSKDPETKKSDYKPVLQLILTKHTELFVLTYNDANGDAYELKVSGEHPFWVSDKGWVSARQLAIADKLLITDNTIVDITNITIEKAAPGETFTTYNFEVDDFHTYFVLQEGKKDGIFAVWVHNAKQKCGPASEKHHAIPWNNSTYKHQLNRLVRQAGVNLKTYTKNLREIIGHKGPHSESYHLDVQQRLNMGFQNVRGQGQKAAQAELDSIMNGIWKDIGNGSLKLYRNKNVRLK